MQDLLHPPTMKGLGETKDRSASSSSSSGTVEELTSSSAMHDSPEDAGGSGPSGMGLGMRQETLAERVSETPGSVFDARSSTVRGRRPGGAAGEDRVTPGDAGGDAAMSVDDEGTRGAGDGVDARRGLSPLARERFSELSGTGSTSMRSQAGPTCEGSLFRHCPWVGTAFCRSCFRRLVTISLRGLVVDDMSPHITYP